MPAVKRVIWVTELTALLKSTADAMGADSAEVRVNWEDKAKAVFDNIKLELKIR